MDDEKCIAAFNADPDASWTLLGGFEHEAVEEGYQASFYKSRRRD